MKIMYNSKVLNNSKAFSEFVLGGLSVSDFLAIFLCLLIHGKSVASCCIL